MELKSALFSIYGYNKNYLNILLKFVLGNCFVIVHLKKKF